EDVANTLVDRRPEGDAAAEHHPGIYPRDADVPAMLPRDRLQNLDLQARRLVLVRGAGEGPEPGIRTGKDAAHFLHAFHRRDFLQFVGDRGRREIAVAGLVQPVAQGIEDLRLPIAHLRFAVPAVYVLRLKFEN